MIEPLLKSSLAPQPPGVRVMTVRTAPSFSRGSSFSCAASTYSSICSKPVPSGAEMLAERTPTSSAGASSDSRVRNKAPATASRPPTATMGISGFSSVASSRLAYQASSRLNLSSIQRAIRPRSSWRSSLEQSIGARLSARKPEKATAPIIAAASSRKRSPVVPAMNMIGTNTAQTTRVVETMAKATCRAP